MGGLFRGTSGWARLGLPGLVGADGATRGAPFKGFFKKKKRYGAALVQIFLGPDDRQPATKPRLRPPRLDGRQRLDAYSARLKGKGGRPCSATPVYEADFYYEPCLRL